MVILLGVERASLRLGTMKHLLSLLGLVALALTLSLSPANAQSVLSPSQDTSLEAKQTRAAARIKSLTSQNYQQLLRAQKSGIDLVWRNSEGLTPQQVCDALGTSAGKIFAIHGTITDALVAAQTADGVAVNVALPTNAFTVNQDGTVTVSSEPYAPPSP